MAETTVLAAEARTKGSKGAVRSLRSSGRVPAVIYGEKKEPELIHLPYKELLALYETGTFMSHVLDLDIAGRKERVIPRDVQLEPVRDFIFHVDFLRIGKGARIDVDVPVHFINEEECPGLRQGGVLNIVRHDVGVSAPADSIPEALEVDLTGKEVGDSIHISEVALPKGVEPTITDRDFTIATIAAPTVAPAADEEGEEGESEGEAEEGGNEE